MWGENEPSRYYVALECLPAYAQLAKSGTRCEFWGVFAALLVSVKAIWTKPLARRYCLASAGNGEDVRPLR
jgi:hypothetical protein